MRYVKIDPPGTWCNNQALRDILRSLPVRPHSFVDVGCGGGLISKVLLDMGMEGTALDYSKDALAVCRAYLADYAAQRKITIVEGDVTGEVAVPQNHDCGISYMVMEHVEDDIGFVKRCAGLVRQDGYFIFAVPGRRDKWSFEDETVGHLRRYNRADMKRVLEAAGLKDVRVISVAVPTANLLFGIGNLLVRHSAEAQKKETLSLEEQTKLSGIREIPWKTVFPSWLKIILNPVTLYPLFVLQRLFYNTGLGIALVGYGRVDKQAIG